MGGGPTFDPAFSLLYSVYSIPNTVLPFGGVLLDRLSLGRSLVALTATQLVGQLLFATGSELHSWGLMITGRVVFGVGGELLTVANNALVSRWFGSQEAATAFGVIVGFGRACSVLNDFVSPLFAQPPDAYFLSAGLCGVSVLAAVMAAVLESQRPVDGEGDGKPEPDATRGLEDSPGGVVSPEEPSPPTDDSWWELLFGGVRRFPPAFWILSVAWVLASASVAAFNNVAVDYLSLRWPDASRQVKGRTLALIYITTAVTSPLVGALLDRLQGRWRFAIVGLALVMLSHGMLGVPALWVIPAEVGFCTLGLGYAFLAGSVWSLVPLVVPREYRSTAFGTATAFQNIGLAAFPLAVGVLQPGSTGCGAQGDWGYICVASFLGSAALAASAVFVALGCFEDATVKMFAGTTLKAEASLSSSATSPLLEG